MVNISEITIIIEENIIQTLSTVVEIDENEIEVKQTPLEIIAEQTLIPSKQINQGDCSICLDLLSKNEDYCLKIKKCSHIFHETCIVQWLSKNTTCPICRYDLCSRN